MANNTSSDTGTLGPFDELKAVLRNLDDFAKLNEQKELHWSNTLFMLRCFFSEDYRSNLVEERRRLHQKLFNSIDWIKKNYSLIEKGLHSADEEQKKIAEYALETINRYNEVLEKEKLPPTEWNEKFYRFILEQAGLIDDELLENKIEIPKPIVHQRDETITKPTSRLALKAGRNVTISPVATSSSQRIDSIARPFKKSNLSEGVPSIHEINAFQVKVYSLINEHGMSLESIREALEVIKAAPIEAKMDKSDVEKTTASILSLHQTLSFLPGEVIELSGAFQRVDPQSTHSIPLLETFRLSSTSTQTGHPDPRQHTGWALPHSLIPSFPLRPHQLPLLQPLYRRKNEAAVALLPKGMLNSRARQLFALKKKAFELDKDSILDLHFKLSRAIINASPSTPLSEAAELVQNRFFQNAKLHPQGIEFLAETHQKLNEALIVKPNELLKSAYLDRSHPNLQVEDAEVKLQEAESLLSDAIFKGLQDLQNMKSDHLSDADAAAIDYMCAMGALLSEAVRNILMQQYSEIIGFKPPMLNDFEQKLQACAHKHLKDFLDELENDEDLEAEGVLHTIIARIYKHLNEEIELFNARTFDKVDDGLSELVHELEAYYHARYYARTSRGR